jgi:hypothetical protein
MKNLNYELKQLCQRNNDGSFATRADRERLLSLAATQLVELGFVSMNAHSLRPKHVEALVDRWKQENLSTGAVKNRMAALRWWAEKVNKQNVVKRTNAEYGIDKRVFMTNVSKATTLDATQLASIKDPYTRASLMLQATFGLRREESIKIIPSWADRGNYLSLKDTWTKGGLARRISIVTPEQRMALDEAKAVANKGSLIPKGFQYRDQLHRFRSQCASANISRVHGLRHRYALERYFALTGWKSPSEGGPSSHQLTAIQKKRDREVRLIISREMGHQREQITAIYCGR